MINYIAIMEWEFNNRKVIKKTKTRKKLRPELKELINESNLARIPIYELENISVSGGNSQTSIQFYS